jgi:hypothetical protein
MPHSAELRLRAMPHSAQFRLRAMPHSGELKKKFYLRPCAMPASVKFKSKILFFCHRIELLREFESICKTVLAYESGDPGVQFDEKTRSQKSRATVPLNKKKSALEVQKNCLAANTDVMYCNLYRFYNMYERNKN